LHPDRTPRHVARPAALLAAGAIVVASVGWIGACSFEPAAGLGADASREDSSEDASADVGTRDSFCPSGGCPCPHLDVSTGVCSEGRFDGEECQPPANWVEEEGPDGGCGDGADNDCDGDTDENCECSTEDTESCYMGPDGTRGTGVCKAGERKCTPEGTWSQCEGEVTPGEETCGNDRDDDCNGTVDDGEGCTCNYEEMPEGVCTEGTYDSARRCAAPDSFESAEAACADGLDNDCDGPTDFADGDCKRPVGAQCGSDKQCQSDGCAKAPDEQTGDCAHRIFVTSNTYAPDFGSTSGADALCGMVARNANLTGNWKAVISVQGDGARKRIRVDAPIANLNKDLVALDEPDLWDRRIRNAIEYDETGTTNDTLVWSGTNPDGSWDGADERNDTEDCSSWTSTSDLDEAEVGRSTTTRADWIVNAGTGVTENRECDNRAALYCIDGQ